MTDFPLQGDALIGAIYRLALHSRRHRGYNLATFTDNVLRPIGDKRFRVVMHQKTLDIRALAVWQELTQEESDKTARYYISEFIARDTKSAAELATDIRSYVFSGGDVHGVPAFLEAAGETRSLASFRA